MSFQWIIDNCETMRIDTQPVVAQTETRDGTVRATSRGGSVWEFTVQLPDGPSWEDYRQDIAKAQALDRYTTGNIQINTAGQDWLIGYQGNVSNVSAVTASWTQGSATVTLTGGQAASGYNFRAGDIIQLGSSGKVYRVNGDVAYNSNTVTVHRPVIDSTGSGTLRIGPNCVFTVICKEFPQWTLFARNQVGWDGPFVFQESLV